MCLCRVPCRAARAAAVYLGIKAYGVHINGFTDTQHGEEMWVATRSLKKPTWPGKLDHIVAGGQARPYLAVHCGFLMPLCRPPSGLFIALQRRNIAECVCSSCLNMLQGRSDAKAEEGGGGDDERTGQC